MPESPALKPLDWKVLRTIYDFEYEPYPSFIDYGDSVTRRCESISPVPLFIIEAVVAVPDVSVALRALMNLGLVARSKAQAVLPSDNRCYGLECRLPDGRELRVTYSLFPEDNPFFAHPSYDISAEINGGTVFCAVLSPDASDSLYYAEAYSLTATGIELVRNNAVGDAGGKAARDGLALTGEAKALPDKRHSDDFRSVHWHGIDYSFTATQAACVRVLWEAMENGTPEVGKDTILEKAGSETSRLDDIFRNSPAWGTMIVSGSRRGTKRLADPPKT